MTALSVRCAEPIAGGTSLCPELLGACPDHPVCGDLEPLTQTVRCRRSPCNGVHSGDGQDAWTSEVRHDKES